MLVYFVMEQAKQKDAIGFGLLQIERLALLVMVEVGLNEVRYLSKSSSQICDM